MFRVFRQAETLNVKLRSKGTNTVYHRLSAARCRQNVREEWALGGVRHGGPLWNDPPFFEILQVGPCRQIGS